MYGKLVRSIFNPLVGRGVLILLIGGIIASNLLEERILNCFSLLDGQYGMLDARPRWHKNLSHPTTLLDMRQRWLKR